MCFLLLIQIVSGLATKHVDLLETDHATVVIDQHRILYYIKEHAHSGRLRYDLSMN